MDAMIFAILALLYNGITKVNSMGVDFGQRDLALTS
jgi:hypothetical protein